MKLDTILEFLDLTLGSKMATLREGRVFIEVSRSEKHTIEFSDLAHETCIPRPSLCRALKSLEDLSLVTRWRPRENMQRVIVSLTDDGRTLARKMGVA